MIIIIIIIIIIIKIIKKKTGKTGKRLYLLHIMLRYPVNKYMLKVNNRNNSQVDVFGGLGNVPDTVNIMKHVSLDLASDSSQLKP